MKSVATRLLFILLPALVVGGMVGLRGGLVGTLVLLAGGLLLATRIPTRAHRSPEVQWDGLAQAAPVTRSEGSISTLNVTRALGRVEGRELARSAWFSVGVGFWLMLIGVFGWLFVQDNEQSWWLLAGLLPVFAHPFCGMVVVAAHRNRCRAARDGCDELFDSCPVDRQQRTLGHLASAWVAALTALGGAAALFAVMLIRQGDRIFGPMDHEIVVGFLLVAVLSVGAVALGVLVARVGSVFLVPLVAVVLVGVMSGQISGRGGDWRNSKALATVVFAPVDDHLFFTRPQWSRVVWFIALTGLVGVFAVLGRTFLRPVVATGLAFAVIAAISAVVIVQPASDAEAASIARLVTHPDESLTCVGAGPEVSVCVYEPYSSLGRLAADAVRPVADAIPTERRRHLRYVTRFRDDPLELQPEIRRLVDRVATDGPNDLRLQLRSHPDVMLAARLRLAAAVTGLPTEVGADGIALVVAGEARGVVVLWLATRGLSERDEDALLRPDDPGGEPVDTTDLGNIWPGGCHDESSVLQWAPADLEVARAVTDLPDDEVGRVIATNWERLIDPSTSTDDLLEALGLAAQGPAEPIEARAYSC